MKDVVDSEIIEKMLSLAFQCIASTRLDRPEMKVVGKQLSEIRMNYFKSWKKKEKGLVINKKKATRFMLR